MFLIVLAYLAGVLTILSPCILPVLPFVFARADRSFLRSGLPMLGGMAVTFAAVATLASVAGGWVVAANQYGRVAALVLLAVFGLTLIDDRLAEWLARPFVALGDRLSRSADRGAATGSPSLATSVLLGVATGLLWAPCAGPVLGLILTGAALRGASAWTSFLLLAYAAGAVTSLALALLVGGRIFAAMKRSLGAGAWIRRGLGAAVLLAVAAIALGVDRGFLTRASLAGTASLEQGLLDELHPGGAPPAPHTTASAAPASEALPVEGTLPSLSGAVAWLNSPPLDREALAGKVVLVDFWTYSCINCLRTLPYVRAWAEKYRDRGLIVIGVHAPEFAFEKDVHNVERAVSDLQITYPVAIDNDYAIWNAFDNRYWPAHYFIDAQGRIRHHHFGEGGYDESERVIQELLAEAGRTALPAELVAVRGAGVEMPPDADDVASPETYIGYQRAERFVSPGGAVRDARHAYGLATTELNEWALAGDWTIGPEHAVLDEAGGRLVFRFRARDLHLVLGPGPEGRPVRFRVTLDGAAPGGDRGVDVDAAGEGVVTGQRLYQLVRQSGAVGERTFEIEFLDPGVQVYAFTFG
ncbi:MAG TPA: cytochrome c biogenesis protein DipZ [Myxococcota bacterium]|nr:cytochrome c biogenesis protein DipZ [Myxococcota bacterium]